MSSAGKVAYQAAFTVVGHYQVDVRLQGAALRADGCKAPQIAAALGITVSVFTSCRQWASPIAFRVDAGPIEASSCTAAGDGLSSYLLTGQFFTGKQFDILSADRFGNRRMGNDASSFSVVTRMVSESPVVGTVAAGPEAGRYMASYSLAAAGRHRQKPETLIPNPKYQTPEPSSQTKRYHPMTLTPKPKTPTADPSR